MKLPQKLLLAAKLFCLLLTSGAAANGQDKTFKPEDRTYDKSIASVQLYAQFGNHSHKDAQPMMLITQPATLVLEFDRIGQAAGQVHAQIIHCNADWAASQYRPLDYLTDYNEFPNDKAELSINTKLDYTHYTMELPKPKITGNYIVKVYDNGDKDDLLITRRFIVYDNILDIKAEMGAIGHAEDARRMHRIDFKISYNRFKIENPNTNVKVTLRQNHRWDNAITKLKPLYVRDNIKELDYNFFNNENCFMAGNEFRYFTSKSFRNGGFNVKGHSIKTSPVVTTLHDDKSRKDMAYSQVMDDHNGVYRIQVEESVQDEVEADYSAVLFTLKEPEPPQGEVYVVGAFSDWQTKESNKMVYNAAKAAYTAKITLKQGTYDYAYVLVDAGKRDDLYFEGSHSLAQNDYDIIVYYRAPGARGDAIIGYYRVSK